MSSYYVPNSARGDAGIWVDCVKNIFGKNTFSVVLSLG